MKEKLTQMLQSQIANVLEKIDEEQNSNTSDIQNDWLNLEFPPTWRFILV